VGSARGGESKLHTAFLVIVGLIGWSAVAWALPPDAAWPRVEAAALFLMVVAGARAMAFPLAGADGDAEVSLDSAIFIAASACLGPRVTATGVGLILTTDALVRGFASPRSGSASASAASSRRAGDRVSVGVHALYLGGLSAGLMALWSRAFGIARYEASAEAVWVIPALGGAFLITHYLVQTVAARLGGRRLRSAVRRNAIGVLAEATLLPLASAIVLIWDPRRPVPFALLGGTYLLVNYGFNRLAQMTVAMRRRVAELETLNRTARALGASLEAPQLVSALLRETAHALPQAMRLEAIVRIGGEPLRFAFEPALRAGFTARESREPADAAARLWLRSRESQLADGVNDPRCPDARARLVVPLVMYGENIGALVAYADEEGAFGAHELTLLEAIAGQAAAAVENARLYGLANIDGLTGLYVRRYFDARVAEEIERARRFASSFALVLLDLDDFKQMNDTHGHPFGDRVLREIAAIAASQLRGVDLAARYGGEELAFLLPRTSLADAQAVAERIREAVAAHRLGDGENAPVITASLGVAAWAESGVDDAQSLVSRADAALYRAKAAGKNRVALDLVTFELTPSLAPIRRRRA
jgi:diguanylate cyclase (GGDEF)-like protein